MISITVEGPPKSGKPTAARMVVEKLVAEGWRCEILDEGKRLLYGDEHDDPARQATLTVRTTPRVPAG